MRSNPFAIITLLLVAAVGCSRKTEDRLPPLNPRPGSLEFCIVANETDDGPAFEDAAIFFERASTSADMQAKLKALAEAGSPPPDLEPISGVPFVVREEVVRYRWVAMGTEYVKDLFRNPSTREVQVPESVLMARAEGQMVVYQGFALWSRPCINANLTPEERLKKGADYFMLVRRTPEGKEITEAHLEKFDPSVDSQRMLPSIAAKLNEEGGKRMHQLTAANVSDHVNRHMAIIIQGEILSAPTVQSAIGEHFQISGDTFTVEYVDEIVRRVRTAGQ